MATRSRGLSASFGWLNRGVTVGFRHPRPLFGAAALLFLLTLIPTFITLPMQLQSLHGGTPFAPSTYGWIMALSMLLGLLLFPLHAGYLQLVDAAEQGLPARAGDIFKPYREGKALRLFGYALVVIVVYLAIFAIVIAVRGTGIVHWYMQLLTAQASHQPPQMGLPDGFGITLLIFIVLVIFTSGFHSIALGQIALRSGSVLGAVGDGLLGALKNMLPLLMLAVTLIVVWIGVALCFGILAAVLALIGKLVGPWLMVVLLVPLYFALMLTVFTAMFGVMYYIWRDVCGDDLVTGAAEAVAA